MTTKSLNVLYINHYCSSNDAAWLSTYEVVKGLTSIGHKALILTHDPRNLDDQVKVLRIGVILPPYIFDKSRLVRFLRSTVAYLMLFLVCLKVSKRKKVDCFFSQHHNFHLATFTTSILSVLLNIPYVVKIQDGVPWGGKNLLERAHHYFMEALNGYALRRAKYVLVLSEELKSLLIEIFRIPNDRFIILPNAINIEGFSVKPSRIEELKTRLGLRNERTLVFVGNTAGRGVESLIEALPYVTSVIPSVKLLIVGLSPNRNKLENLAELLGVKKCMRFIGSVDHSVIPTFISMCDVGVGPLVSAPFTIGAIPRKVLEYMACNKPVVACHGSISKDLIIDGWNGMLVNPHDKSELASTVCNLLQDTKSSMRMGMNARSHVEKFYGYEVLVEKLNMLQLRNAEKKLEVAEGGDIRVN